MEPTYHFKVLVPSMVAGAIIGKGGETIAQLQKDTGARVKMSKSHDFYPGEYFEFFIKCYCYRSMMFANVGYGIERYFSICKKI